MDWDKNFQHDISKFTTVYHCKQVNDPLSTSWCSYPVETYCKLKIDKFYLSIYQCLSICPSLSLCLSLCVSLSLTLCFSVSLSLSTHTTIYIYIYIYALVFFLTVAEGDPKVSFSIATTPKCKRECYAFPLIAPLELVTYLIMLSVKEASRTTFLSLVWID